MNPNIICKEQPSEDDILQWLSTTEGFLQGLVSIDETPLQLAPHQIDFLHDRSKFRAVEKARGVGFSFVCAAEALAKAHLRRDYTAILISLNLEEAVEKIRYANQLHSSLPLKWQKKKVVDNKTSIEFEDPTGRYRSRLISHPCKDPRGKHNADVYLDEFAHYGAKQRAVFVAAVPIVSRGTGQLTVGSTPLTANDVFHSIMHKEDRQHVMFSRMSVPWWLCPDFCHDLLQAAIEAPDIDTAERVQRFGRQTLIDIFYTMERDDFRQEYELSYNDESQTYFPYWLIFACCDDSLDTFDSVESMLKNTSGDLYAGFDVGRTRNTSELIVLERKAKRLIYRLGRSFDQSSFQNQEAFLSDMMKRSDRIRRLCIDRHGLGMHLAENMRTEFRSRVEGVALIGQAKESLAVNLKIAFENEGVYIPRKRELISQIHSIKKTSTHAGYARFDTEKNEKAHADIFWALALAVHAAGDGGEKRRRREIKVTIV